MAWQTPKTNWAAADGVRDSDFNRIEGNALELYNTKAELAAFEALKTRVDNGLFDIINRTEIGNIGVGNEFGLYENGILVPFIKLMSNYEGSGRDLVIRKDAYKMDTLVDTGTLYENCKQDAWLNNDYIATLDATTQNVLSAVGIEVWGLFGLGTISRKVFLLSLSEYGQTSVYGVEAYGESVPYFNSNARRIARFNGSTVPHWTRSLRTLNPPTAACIDVNGNGSGPLQDTITYSAGIRPAFTLPTSFEVIGSVPSTANVMAIAEVIE